jgi:hypothetical protein
MGWRNGITAPQSDRLLTNLLYFIGISGLLAVVAVCVPMSWMATAHDWLGLGEMPAAPTVEYLARSLSAFYALFGALSCLLAADVQRYRPLVLRMSVPVVILGVAMIGIDLAAGMPWWWLATEGPTTIVGGALMFLLARPMAEKR